MLVVGSTNPEQTSNTFDIKTLLPTTYKNLTNDNFAVQGTIRLSYLTNNMQSGVHTYHFSYLTINYDSDNGILTVGSLRNSSPSGITMVGYCYANILCFYIEE